MTYRNASETQGARSLQTGSGGINAMNGSAARRDAVAEPARASADRKWPVCGVRVAIFAASHVEPSRILGTPFLGLIRLRTRLLVRWPTPAEGVVASRSA